MGDLSGLPRQSGTLAYGLELKPRVNSTVLGLSEFSRTAQTDPSPAALPSWENLGSEDSSYNVKRKGRDE